MLFVDKLSLFYFIIVFDFQSLIFEFLDNFEI